MSKIDSFISEFKKLLHSGKDAQLEIKPAAGKAVVTLTAEVDGIPPPLVRSRNGPARQHRRERQAADRESAAEEASKQQVDGSVPEKRSSKTSRTYY